jgi:hypothetical protein
MFASHCGCNPPVILDTWEAEIGRLTVQGQSEQIVCETPPISKITRAKCT